MAAVTFWSSPLLFLFPAHFEKNDLATLENTAGFISFHLWLE